MIVFLEYLIAKIQNKIRNRASSPPCDKHLRQVLQRDSERGHGQKEHILRRGLRTRLRLRTESDALAQVLSGVRVSQLHRLHHREILAITRSRSHTGGDSADKEVLRATRSAELVHTRERF